jgi:hypothetical protein
MSARQPINCELEARQGCFDLQEYRERAIKTGQTSAGWDSKAESLERIDQIGITIPKAASARAHEIKIDKRDRVLVSAASRSGQGVRAGLVVSALVASIGLASVVISVQVSPFGLARVGGSNRYHFLDLNAASSSLPELNSSARIPDSKKGDRLQIGGVAGRTSRETTAEAPNSPKVSSPAASSRGYGLKPSLGAASPATASTSKASPIAQQPTTTSIGPMAGDLQPRAKLTPTPDTRPTTIEGWTVREVIDGTAVLEGPNGVLKATRGDTVPGVGRVYTIVRWGSRWIVATSRGLITTP